MASEIAKMFLNKFLGEYLEGIDSDSIGVGVKTIINITKS